LSASINKGKDSPVNTSPDGYYQSNIDEIHGQNWPDLLPQLLKYAAMKAHWHFWMGEADLSPEDLVNEAVARVYGVGSGDTFRNWNKERYPDFYEFVISVIDSLTNHQVAHACQFRRESFYNEDGSEKIYRKFSAAATCATSAEADLEPPDPDRPVKQKEVKFYPLRDEPLTAEELLDNEQGYRRLLGFIQEATAGDDDMALVMLCLEDGIAKPADIAAITELDIKTVYAVLKKLRNHLRKRMDTITEKG
jgi:DNA-directed RNA polymerase specialized sigma24 family protein